MTEIECVSFVLRLIFRSREVFEWINHIWQAIQTKMIVMIKIWFRIVRSVVQTGPLNILIKASLLLSFRVATFELWCARFLGRGNLKRSLCHAFISWEPLRECIDVENVQSELFNWPRICASDLLFFVLSKSPHNIFLLHHANFSIC